MQKLSGLAAILFAVLPGSVHAQQHAEPYFFPVEVVHAQGVRDIETVISRGGWHLLGRDPEGYRIGQGKTDGMTGDSAMSLQSCGSKALRGHGALERTIPAADYAGGRVRVSARVKMDGGGASQFYINVLGQGGRHLYTVGQPNTPNGDWESRAIVADVRDGAIGLDIGISLWGSSTATVWMEHVTVERVSDKVPLTGEASDVTFINRRDDIVSCDGLKDGIRE